VGFQILKIDLEGFAREVISGPEWSQILECGISYCFTIQYNATVVTEAQVISIVSIPNPLSYVLLDADLFAVRKPSDFFREYHLTSPVLWRKRHKPGMWYGYHQSSCGVCAIIPHISELNVAFIVNHVRLCKARSLNREKPLASQYKLEKSLLCMIFLPGGMPDGSITPASGSYGELGGKFFQVIPN
jgi:hypothetical protein